MLAAAMILDNSRGHFIVTIDTCLFRFLLIRPFGMAGLTGSVLVPADQLEFSVLVVIEL